MSMRDIRENVAKNRFIRLLYSSEFYFRLGKDQIAKFTNPMNEISSMIIILVFFFGFDIKSNRIMFISLILVAIVVLTVLGWFVKHSGLWHVDMYVTAEKNPVTWEMLEAARKINRRFDK